MIRTIKEQFDPENDVKDLCILYEVTGYQGGDDPDFWENYKDFYELGKDSNFIQLNKIEIMALNKE